MSLRNAVAALDAFDDFIEFRAKVWEPADAREVLELDDVNRLGPDLDPGKSQPEKLSGWLQSP